MEGDAPSPLCFIDDMTSFSPLRMRLQATLAAAVSLVLWWRFRGVFMAGFSGLLASLALIAWISPARYAPVQRGLDAFARTTVVGFSWFILGLVYFGLFAPLRWLGAIFGRDPLKLNARRNEASFLRPLPPTTADHFKRQY